MYRPLSGMRRDWGLFREYSNREIRRHVVFRMSEGVEDAWGPINSTTYQSSPVIQDA